MSSKNVSNHKLRVAFAISGKGRLALKASACSEQLCIDPVLFILDEKADAETESSLLSEGRILQRFDSSERKKFDSDILKACDEHNVELLVLTFDKLVSHELLTKYSGRVINVHMSMLPAFKGFGALKNAFYAGVRFVGATIHEVTSDIDGGSIVAQCMEPLRPEDTVETIGNRLYEKLEVMYLNVINWYAQDRILHDEHGRIWIAEADYSDGLLLPVPEIFYSF